jgi:hypothetical protein
MAPLHIDRLSVELHGDTGGTGVAGKEIAAKELATELVTRLAAAGALPAAGDIPVIRVDVPMPPRERPSDVTARILAEALRELRRGGG